MSAQLDRVTHEALAGKRRAGLPDSEEGHNSLRNQRRLLAQSRNALLHEKPERQLCQRARVVTYSVAERQTKIRGQ